MNTRQKQIALAIMAALSSSSALALVGGSIDPNSTTSPWASVGAVTIGGNAYSGVLVDSTHVLTAAHVVAGQEGSAGNVSFSLNVGGNLTETLSASSISVFGGYNGTTPGADGVWHDDLAIITLSTAITSVVPIYGLYGGSMLNKSISMVGYGSGGDGVNGVTTGANASIKRVGQNRVDRVLKDDDGTSNMEIFMFDFDGPTRTSNVLGSATALNGEAQYAGGDSGSPVFIKDKGIWKIAGVGTFNTGTQFGTIGGGTVLSSYIPWIQSTLAGSSTTLTGSTNLAASTMLAAPVPEPRAWAMMLAGMGLIVAAVRAKSHI